jgi:hypothetical protein
VCVDCSRRAPSFAPLYLAKIAFQQRLTALDPYISEYRNKYTDISQLLVLFRGSKDMISSRLEDLAHYYLIRSRVLRVELEGGIPVSILVFNGRNTFGIASRECGNKDDVEELEIIYLGRLGPAM